MPSAISLAARAYTPPNPAEARGAAKTESSAEDLEREKLSRACEEFESIFLGHLLKSMRATTKVLGDDGSPAGAGMMTEMMDEHLARALASKGGIGLGEALEEQFASRFDSEAPIRYRPAAAAPVLATGPAEGAAEAAAEPDTVEGRVSRYEPFIREAASSFDLKPELLRAVIAQESAGRPEAVSPKGAKGLMQLMDGTAEELGVRNSFDPEQNIRGGARYLRRLLDRFSGDLEKALAGYNAGPGAVERHGGVPPYRETRDYVSRVKRRMGI